jgi:hypothetical protein
LFVESEFAVQTEMHVQNLSSLPVVKEVFSAGIDRFESASVKRFRPGSKSTLGRTDAQRKTGKHPRMIASVPVYRMTFRHCKTSQEGNL